eukprot:3825760-Amphidinium_carterae.1
MSHSYVAKNYPCLFKAIVPIVEESSGEDGVVEYERLHLQTELDSSRTGLKKHLTKVDRNIFRTPFN